MVHSALSLNPTDEEVQPGADWQNKTRAEAGISPQLRATIA
jgi:hypothetical protein